MKEAYTKEENFEAWTAWQCVCQTSVNIFLTGKAGTGKTTFLKKLRETSVKRMVVVAPTGVAAINAGGVTIHSFFQLPLTPFIPGAKFKSDFSMRREKINIIRTLDMLVIDEISMVRADLLDSVDAALKHYRRSSEPFGGVQLLMIGDLQQLPPVVTEADREIIGMNYESPYFFSSKALQQSRYVTIELKRVYRQKDLEFVEMLNKIRDNRMDVGTLNKLNERYVADFNPPDEEGYIRLTTHNGIADNINSMKLLAIKSKLRSYDCKVEGNFPESSYPADKTLSLKVGAQVMFIKNDYSEEHRYYNGKLGIVTEMRDESVVVECIDDGIKVALEYEDWDNTKYVINKETNEISEEVEGKFSQIPLRLAWAVTIHKSQGLTFDKAIIDAHMSFAHGQVYVALSRCRTLEGIVLSSKISHDSIITDRSVVGFIQSQVQQSPTEAVIEKMKAEYCVDLICQLFNFRGLTSNAHRLLRLFEENCHKTYPKLISELTVTLDIVKREISDVADKFVALCNYNLQTGKDVREDQEFMQRVGKGAEYFRGKVQSLLEPLADKTDVEVDNKTVATDMSDLRGQLEQDVKVKLAELVHVSKEGFSTTGYLVARAAAILENEKTGRKTSDKTRKPKQTSSDIKYPKLYAELVKWRTAKAAELDAPAYAVLTQKAVLGIVSELPLQKKELKAINGIGPQKLKEYGDEILEMVNNFVKNNKI